MFLYDMYNKLIYSYIIFFVVNGINLVWLMVVNWFNEVGCVKWVLCIFEIYFIEVVGNLVR